MKKMIKRRVLKKIYMPHKVMTPIEEPMVHVEAEVMTETPIMEVKDSVIENKSEVKPQQKKIKKDKKNTVELSGVTENK